jgi:uncharacterized protein YbjT (DUF2867 family)
MKIVVIGGTGLIGSKLATILGEHGHQAVAAAPNTPGSTADDVAQAVSRTAEGSPLNGRVDVAGPEQYRMDEFFRMALAAGDDQREVVTDKHAKYFGTELSERSLVPLGEPILGATRYADWHGQAHTHPVPSSTT